MRHDRKLPRHRQIRDQVNVSIYAAKLKLSSMHPLFPTMSAAEWRAGAAGTRRTQKEHAKTGNHDVHYVYIYMFSTPHSLITEPKSILLVHGVRNSAAATRRWDYPSSGRAVQNPGPCHKCPTSTSPTAFISYPHLTYTRCHSDIPVEESSTKYAQLAHVNQSRCATGSILTCEPCLL